MGGGGHPTHTQTQNRLEETSHNETTATAYEKKKGETQQQEEDSNYPSILLRWLGSEIKDVREGGATPNINTLKPTA